MILWQFLQKLKTYKYKMQNGYSGVNMDINYTPPKINPQKIQEPVKLVFQFLYAFVISGPLLFISVFRYFLPTRKSIKGKVVLVSVDDFPFIFPVCLRLIIPTLQKEHIILFLGYWRSSWSRTRIVQSVCSRRSLCSRGWYSGRREQGNGWITERNKSEFCSKNVSL